MYQKDIRLRLYKLVLMAGIAMSVLSIVGNIFTGYPLDINVKWIILIVICIFALYFWNNKKYSNYSMIALYILLIAIFLPLGFFHSGGSSNIAIGYVILFLITITFLFKGGKQLFFVHALTFVFMGLLIIEYLYPQYVSIYSKQMLFMDRMIQTPLLIIISYIVLNLFSKEYESIHTRLHLSANHDELTGLYNRRAFNRSMEEITDTTDQSTFLILLDLDNFKKINDQFGHHVGDEVLVKLAEFLKVHFDLNQHMVSRWGGDEFAIIYQGEKPMLLNKLEAIKIAFKQFVSVYEKSTDISLSVITLSDYKTGADGLIAADHYLYAEKAKKSQR